MKRPLITGAAQSVTEVASRAAEAAKHVATTITGKNESKPKAPRASVKANTSSGSTKRSSAKKALASKAKKSKK